MKKLFTTIVLSLLVVSGGALAGDDSQAKKSLYERLGSMEGIHSIVSDTIALHVKNEKISHYFDGVDLDNLAQHVAAFFAAGTGGPADYQGRDMTSAHEGMNMTDADFDSAVADVLAAVKGNGVDDESAAEVAAILESLRPAVMGAAAN